MGTNGGGFFNANAAHPYENPTAITNLVQTLLMIVLPSSIVLCFGEMIGNRRQGWVLYGVMGALLILFLPLVVVPEQAGTPLLAKAGIEMAASSTQPGGNMEGKEVRFGVVQSGLFAGVTTSFTTGSVNSMHDSFTPLGGMGAFIGMMLQCVFGGKGVGFLAALVYGIIGVFVAGLMVGRTPEFLGKKIEKPEIVLVSLTLLIHPLVILAPTGWSVVAPYGLASMGNAAMHGYSEVLYAFTTSAANNGSAFAGLNANTPWYNLATAIVILLGRYPPIIFMMAVAGSVAAKPTLPLTVRHAAHGHVEVRDVLARHHPGGRRADVLSRSRARTDRRVLRHEERSPLLTQGLPHSVAGKLDMAPEQLDTARRTRSDACAGNSVARRTASRPARRGSRSLTGPTAVGRARSHSLMEVRSAGADPQPRDVRGLARRARDRCAHDRSRPVRTLKRICGLQRRGDGHSAVDRVVRELRRGAGGRAGQGEGRLAAADQDGADGADAS